MGTILSDKRNGSTAKKAAACLFASLLLILSIFSTGTAAAQKKIDASGNGAGYSAVLYNNTNGLPTSEANDIVQSDNGFIWIGCYSGLIRYDGNEFYRYESSSGIASTVCLFIDSRQRLWIGTNDSGIAVLEDNDFTFYDRASGLRSSSVRSITEDKQGNIIIATTAGVAYIDVDGKLHIIDDALINSEYVCSLYPDDGGTIYGVTLTGGFFTIVDQKISGYYNGPDMGFGIPKSIYPDPKNPGYIYLGSQSDEIYYVKIGDGIEKAKTLYASGLNTINEVRYYDDVLWICADSGIGFFTEDGEFIRLSGIPMTNSIDHMIRDYEGNLWFTSSRQGVMKIVDNRFIDVSEIAGLETLIVNSTCIDGDDLYIATDKGLYIIDSEYKTKENKLTELLKGIRIRCIKRDADGYLWICTYGSNGLVRYDPKTEQVVPFTENDGMTSSRVRMAKVLSDGSVAAATNKGVNIIRGGKVTATYGSNIGIVNLEILCIEEGPRGELYLGSDGGGIYIIDGAKVSRIGIDDGLKSEVILRIKKDPKDEIYWIITSNSISYLKDGKITNVSSFPYSNNFDIFFDNFDRAWILSSNGIYVVKRTDIINDNALEYTLFDKDYGLPGIATANSYSAINDSGDLYVCATTGVYKVNINEETDGDAEIKLSIPFISVDDEYVWIHDNDTVRIPSKCKRLNIYANAFTYSLSNPHLSYVLEGFDDGERHLTKQDMSYASYTNLKGGTYKFVISMIDDVTGEVQKTAKLTIIKETAFYEQTWFLIVLVLILIGLVALFIYLHFRRKTAALLNKQEENRKLINEMLRAFSGCIDMKDAYTQGHSTRVSAYSSMIAEKMGKSPAEIEKIRNIALLHDIGKIGIPDNILNKPGKLNDEEYAIMKSHAQRGYDILKDITIDPDLALGAGYHHEKYDGTGYPSGLKGEEIPEIARIIAVADAFDAMYSTRPYRKKMPIEAVAAEISRCRGTQFAPEIVDVFLKLIEEGRFDDNNVK